LFLALVVAAGAAHAAAPGTCGGLAGKPLGKPLDLLSGRLSMAPLEGAKLLPRGRSIMAADAPVDAETRVYYEKGGKKLVVLVAETFAKAGKDLAKLAGPKVASEPWQAGALRGVVVVPAKIEASPDDPEAVPILSAYVVSPDDTVQLVAFYVSPKAADAACPELAKKLLATLVPGARKLDLAGGKRDLDDLTLLLMPGQALVKQEGPDFVYYLVRAVAPQEKTGVIGIYLGYAPRRLPAAARTEKGILFGKPVDFIVNDGAQRSREVIVPVPGKKYVVHVEVTAADEAVLRDLMTTAATLAVK
jgi:hypothetical protein